MVFNFFANKGAASLLAELDDDSAPLTGSSSSSGKSDTSIDENNTYTFGTGGNPVFSVPDADVSPAKLRSNVITKVASSYVESNTRSTVATNDTFISYGLKQGHIRVLHRYSEARALLEHPEVARRIDPVALSAWLGHGYLPHEHSIYEQISKLRAGERLRWRAGHSAVQKWWELAWRMLAIGKWSRSSPSQTHCCLPHR